MAVTPRPASTVVLMDQMSRIYLTQRPKTMKFMGGQYVFPGGAVEKGDHKADSQFINKDNSNELVNQGYYVAAARELFEEVGVLLCSSFDGTGVHFDKETEQKYRRQLLNGEISFLELLKNEGIIFHLESLTYIGNLTTPEESPIRFDTRFFIAQLPKGQSPKPDLNEIDHAVWYTPEEALLAYKSREISIAPPTILALKTILDHQNGNPLLMPDLAGMNLQDIRELRF
ncbi:NUDIX domain-containing protein [Neobacillus sp. FSL H8-0543]|uniref:NUDIX hydrolase n=1 Tax=Neobacillus sp. FSL H8-0543 TaxID=2954672 RepID=UPI0031598DB8